MKRFSTALLIAIISLTLAHCTAKKTTKTPPPPPPPIGNVETTSPPDIAPVTGSPVVTTEEAAAEAKAIAAVEDVKKRYTEEQMAEGKILFSDNCGKCHKLHQPEARPVSHWELILPRMNKKSGFNAEQGGKVRAYVLAHATKMK